MTQLNQITRSRRGAGRQAGIKERRKKNVVHREGRQAVSALDQSTVRRSAEEREGEARRERERLGEEERKRKREGKAGEMENVTVSQARHPASISKISHLETAFVLIGIALGRLEAQREANLYFTSTCKTTNKQLLLCSWPADTSSSSPGFTMLS